MKLNYRGVQLIFAIISIFILSWAFIGKGNDSEFVWIGLIALTALILFDFFTPQIAGLSEDNPKIKTMRRLNRFSVVLIALCSGLAAWLKNNGAGKGKSEEWIALFIVVLVMAVLGNAAPKIPFNRYMGLRLPWTIRDEAVWRQAHKLLGYITFPLIIILLIGSLLGEPALFIKYIIIAWVAIPGLYSGWYYYMRVNGKR